MSEVHRAAGPRCPPHHSTLASAQESDRARDFSGFGFTAKTLVVSAAEDENPCFQTAAARLAQRIPCFARKSLPLPAPGKIDVATFQPSRFNSTRIFR